MRFFRAPDRTEEILKDLACWVQVTGELAERDPKAVQAYRIAEAMLCDAVTIAYSHRTDHMDSKRAADWIQARTNKLIRRWQEVAP